MNKQKTYIIGGVIAALLLGGLVALLIWLTTRKGGDTKFYTCSSKNKCRIDNSGNRNYPNDLDGCNKDCAKSGGGPYYNCDSTGNCIENTTGGRNYPGDSTCGGKCSPPPHPSPSPSPSGGGVVPNDKTDCLALNYYGQSGVAPQKICGVFDGFSHWTWKDMKRWLAYFKSRTGAKNVIIYEAQFIPESWMNEVKARIIDPDKGQKAKANLLPRSCTTDKNCTGPSPSGTVPGKNWECKNGICVDKCTVGDPPKCTTDNNCDNSYKAMGCPFTGYCKNNGYCHYNTPHSGANATKTCTKDNDCNCKGDSCNIKPNASTGACHMTLPDGTCPKIPGAGGSCPKSICPGGPKHPSTGAYCGLNGFCKKCFKDDKSISPPCITSKEDYETTSPTPWSAWKPGATEPPHPTPQTAAFSNYYTSVGSLWDGTHLSGVKGDAGAALCPYGTYYDPDKGSYGQCVDHQRQDCKPGTDSIMGFCDDPTIYQKEIPKDSLPTITLTWYALVGKAKTDESTAKAYISSVLGFCKNAGIKRLAFPFIVPDGNNTPYMINPAALHDAKAQVNNAINWIVKNVLVPAKAHNVEIGLNVYASYKDARWKSWWQGSGDPACWTDPCVVMNQEKCTKSTSLGCGWQQTKDGCACFKGKSNCESFTTSPAPSAMTPDPCSSPSSLSYCNTGSCSWPYIATFIKLLNQAAKTQNAQDVTFLQVDQEWCHCGTLEDNVECVQKILKDDKFEFTIATSLGTPGSTDPMYTSVPEVYWDAGNQFPCTGGPGTYQYLTPACTTGTSHRKLQNKPQAFYDLIAGDSVYLGSDDNRDKTKKQNAWLGRGKFAATVNSLKKEGNLTVTPSFSIENLSMCSSPHNEMVLTGDVMKGTGRWECHPTKN